MLELQDLRDFSINNWYPMFKDISLQAFIIELPQALIEKLQSDDSSNLKIEDVCDTEYVDKIKNALNSINRNGFIKNNWHAPMDAKMFSLGNELKVTNLNDLMLYLSASPIILEDFSMQIDIPYVLALKPWKNIHPASEFRCIVINKILRGITPRDWPTYYTHFKEEGPQLIETLQMFFADNIKQRFSRRHYTFDVIVTFPTQPVIVDFGPLSNKTNLYAFSWKEIFPLLNKETTEHIPPIFRYLESDTGIMTRTDAIYKIANSFTV